MKRLSFAICALLASALIFSSCEKEETASPLKIDDSQMATMKGYLFAELDLTKPGLEVVPQGTKVFGYITNSDILDNNSNGLWKDTVVVGTDGSYSFTFPIGFTSSTLHIVPLAFEYEQVQGYGIYDTTIPKIYSQNGTTVASATAGGNIPQLQYSYETRSNYQQMTQITGKLFAEMTALNSGYETIPASKTVTFYSNGWVKTITSEGSGIYTIEIPVGQTIYVASEFDADYVIDATTVEASTYSTNSNLGSFSGSVGKDANVYFTRKKK